MRNTRVRYLAAVLGCAALVAVSCGDGGGDGGGNAGPGVRTGPPPTAPPDTGGPLTGLPLDPSRAGRPLLIVKVDNAPRARPQTGLNQADVVVEEAVEGGVTRFATFFHSSDADPVGPVRSARSTDMLLVGPLNRPMFAYAGANTGFERLIARSPVVDVGVDKFPDAYPRQRGRPSPYNLFSSTTKLFARAPAGAQPPPRLFAFRPAGQPVEANGAMPARGVSIQYRGQIVTSVQFSWDPASGTWKRAQDGGPHLDTNRVQIAPKNVVVQLVRYHDTGYRDTSGAPVPEAELLGEGEVWVFTDGKVVKGKWRKTSPEALTEYLDPAGAPIGLTRGQTWVELPSPGGAAIQP